MRLAWPVAGVLGFGVLIAAVMSPSPSSSFACGGATPVVDAGGWHTVGATLDPTAGQAPTYSDHGGMSFAELLVAGLNGGLWSEDLSSVLGLPNRPNFGMPMETPILIRMPGSPTVFTIYKNDVGSGQAGQPHYKIDLHPGIAQALGWTGNSDVQVAVPQGGASSLPVTVPVAQCSQASVSLGQGQDPIPGFTPGRDDMGVDACARPGMPIIAPFASTLVDVIPDWYSGQPLLLFHFDQPQAGTPQGDQYWFVAEEITPSTETIGTDFLAGQSVAQFAPSGTCIEIGWGDPSSNARTLADVTDPGSAHPAAGALTQWGETFRHYFSIK